MARLFSCAVIPAASNLACSRFDFRYMTRGGELNMPAGPVGTLGISTLPKRLALVFFAASVCALPALAQIETVVVTAERKAEDLQTTPIAVSALTSE